MPRIDDYKLARDLGNQSLSGKDPQLLSKYSKADIQANERGENFLILPFLGRFIHITWPDLAFSYQDSKDEIPIQQQVLMLHYLHGSFSSTGAAPTGEWISFQDVPEGRFYMDAFTRRAKDPLIKGFGHQPERMVELASKIYNISSLDYGDFSVIVNALPLVPVALVMWEGDDEFPPEGNILFDRNISGILSAEDIAWLAGMVVYPLIGMGKK
ncbi:MAG: DUF3786 domain-containing protein [Deltaproteobacteria bacterium]|nr:DUF3786 domain-containing protein [Deltaproteobacteria bacterium]